MLATRMFRTSLLAFCALLLLAAVTAGNNAAAQASDEAKWIALLQSDAAWVDKQAACRELRKVGRAASVPVLAALLADPEMSHLARYALEPMQIPEAGAALRDALAKSPAPVQAGLAVSLGVRRDPLATPLLISLLESPDADTVRAAAGALGRIGAPEAAQALVAFAEKATDNVKGAVQEGLIAAAEHLAKENNLAMAVSILEPLITPGTSDSIRAGAFYTLAVVQPQVPDRVFAALSGDDTVLRDMAARIICETKNAPLVMLSVLPTGGQLAMLRALVVRRDPAAHEAVVQSLDSPDREVLLTALKTLSALGDAGDVPRLAVFMSSDDADIAGTARATLATIDTPGVDDALAAILPDAAPAVKPRLLDLMTERRADQALPMALARLQDADAPMRAAALNALAQLGGVDQAPVAVAAVKQAADNKERVLAEKALDNLCKRNGEAVLPVVLEAMNSTADETRLVMLRALSRIGGAGALAGLVAVLDAPEEAFRNEALRELADWPTPDAAPQLLELAKSDQENRHVLGLRGYVRLARAEANPDTKNTMLAAAMGLARLPEEKWPVLAGWGTLKTPASLDALLPHLQDPQIRNEAATAIIAVAAELGKGDAGAKAKAADALKAVVDNCEDTAIRDNAQKALDKLNPK